MTVTLCSTGGSSRLCLEPDESSPYRPIVFL